MNFEEQIRERASCATPMQPGNENRNPPDLRLFELLKEDLQTHGGKVTNPGFLAIAVHRLGNWRMDIPNPNVRAPFTIAYRSAYWLTKALWGIDIPYNSQVGRRLKILHHGSVFIGAWKVGDDVTIRHSVTIGLVRKGTNRSPIIGDRVDLGPGACVAGDIVIGDDCVIGPNTVQTTSMQNNSACLGNPCRIVTKEDVYGPLHDPSLAHAVSK